MDAETGKILFEKDAHTPSPPASMVKMMTTLIIMEKIRDGALKFSDMVTASRWAAQMGGASRRSAGVSTMTHTSTASSVAVVIRADPFCANRGMTTRFERGFSTARTAAMSSSPRSKRSPRRARKNTPFAYIEASPGASNRSAVAASA